MRAAGSAAVILALGAAAGCTVGQGTGEAQGLMFVEHCEENGNDLGSPEAPEPYSLEPNFFAGEPLADIGTGRKANRLLIRLQTTGRRRELNDVLRFDVINTFEVARCVRGRFVNTGGQLKPDFDARNCSWETGSPVVRVAPDSLVAAYLSPRITCQGTHVVGTAVDEAGTPAWDSWMSLVEFGDAVAQPELAPEQRPATDPEFVVNFEERVHAQRFSLTLLDDQVVKARLRNEVPPEPEIGGGLQGFFDFDLERGQGAQTFP